MSNSELLACPTPWCDQKGGEPYVFERQRDCLGVYCPSCGVSTAYFPTEEAAITAWNRRPQLDELRTALRPFAAAAHLLTSAVHNGGIENVREFPTGEEWRTALNLFPEFQGAVRKSPDELRKALGATSATKCPACYGTGEVSVMLTSLPPREKKVPCHLCRSHQP